MTRGPDMPPGTTYRQVRCPSCHWSPIIPRPIGGTIWCLFCGEDTMLIDEGERTAEEFKNQGPGLVIPPSALR